jgi:hypothetical protein
VQNNVVQGREMRKPDPGFDYHRYRQLLAEASDEPKRLALIDLLIEERARDRLNAERASNEEANTRTIIATVHSKGPTFAQGTTPTNSTGASTSAIDNSLDRQLLTDAVDEPKRLAPTELIIQERAQDRLDAQRVSNQATNTSQVTNTRSIIIEALGIGPALGQSAAPTNSAGSSTPAIDHNLDIFYIPATGPLG